MKKTIDKFGHARGYGGNVGPPGVGFVLNSDGNFDLQHRALTNVKNPEDEQDAVTKNFLQRKLGESIQFDTKKDAYNCQTTRVSEVKTPEVGTDAVNLQFLKENTLNRAGGVNFDAQNKRIEHVALPAGRTDAASVAYVEDVVIPRVLLVKTPMVDTDAINFGFFKDKTMHLSGYDNFDAKNKRIKHMAGPTDKNDAVNLSYIEERVLPRISGGTIVLKERSYFDARNKFLRSMADAEVASDAVNLRTFKKLLKAHSYFINREISDLSIHLRREMYSMFTNPPTPSLMKQHLQHLQDIQTDHKRTWRMAVQATQPGQTTFARDERKRIATFMALDEKYIDRYLDDEKETDEIRKHEH